mmetsp:Transcript_32180/g.75556  ORF Transcript_32180/g.75556 Transcript_32180/m.75556 type:complete len:106 (-) Transcript_32180:82-399(-)
MRTCSTSAWQVAALSTSVRTIMPTKLNMNEHMLTSARSKHKPTLGFTKIGAGPPPGHENRNRSISRSGELQDRPCARNWIAAGSALTSLLGSQLTLGKLWPTVKN